MTSGPRRSPARVALITAVAVTTAAAATVTVASAAQAKPAPKVTICHATSSTSNPYVKVTVDTASVLKEGHGSHTGPVFTAGMKKGWGDIIPAFTGFPGLNTTAAGLAILSNNCKAVTNQAPAVSSAAVDSPTNDEGSTVTVTGSFRDPDLDPLILTADNTVGEFTDNGDGTWSYTRPTDDNVGGTVTVTATDPKGATASDSFSYATQNVAPTVTTDATSGDAYGCSVTVAATVTDPGTADTHTYPDGSSAPADKTHRFVSAGTYTIATTITDDDGGVGTDSLDHTVYNRPVAGDKGLVLPENTQSGNSQRVRDLPLKLDVLDCGTTAVVGLTDLRVQYAPIVDGTVGTFTDASSDSSADNGPFMRAQTDGYHYNFRTDALTAGTYRIAVSHSTFVAAVYEDVVIVDNNSSSTGGGNTGGNGGGNPNN